jgi:hypothetical protein
MTSLIYDSLAYRRLIDDLYAEIMKKWPLYPILKPSRLVIPTSRRIYMCSAPHVKLDLERRVPRRVIIVPGFCNAPDHVRCRHRAENHDPGDEDPVAP